MIVGYLITGAVEAVVQKRENDRFFFLCLAAVWLLACVLAFTLNPVTWPNQTF